MARYDAHPLSATSLGNMPLVANFFPEPVNPVVAPSTSAVNNYVATEHGRQLIIGELSTTCDTAYLPDYGLLDAHTIEIIRCHTRRLLSSIYNASSHRRSPIPPSRSPDSPHCRRGINDISVFLYNCEKLIRDFLGKAVIRDMFGTAWICNPSDVQGLRRSLQERLESLVLSLCYDQQPRNGTGDPIQETHCHVHKIGTVVEDMLRCLSLYHLKTVPRQIPRGSLAALGQPVIFSEASPNESLIPIPHFFCDSKQKLHNLMRILFQNRPWHAKIDQEEYVLEDKEQTTVIGTENWRNIVVPGALIHMIMIVKYKGAVSDSRCPSCHAINIEKICQGKKLKCLNCKLISDVAETNRIVELSDENTDSSKGTFSRIRYIREQRTNARLTWHHPTRLSDICSEDERSEDSEEDWIQPWDPSEDQWRPRWQPPPRAKDVGI